MKRFNLFLIMMILVIIWGQIGSADRLHHWVDSKGVSHLSKEPPPQDGKLVEIMEYSTRTDRPKETVQDQSELEREKQNEQVTVEKLQETEAQPKSEDDLATACYIHANMEDVYVYVIEFADTDSVVEKVLYRGTIPNGQKQLIRSKHGKIRFDYKRSSDDRSYGDNRADCANGNVISIP